MMTNGYGKCILCPYQVFFHSILKMKMTELRYIEIKRLKSEFDRAAFSLFKMKSLCIQSMKWHMEVSDSITFDLRADLNGQKTSLFHRKST